MTKLMQKQLNKTQFILNKQLSIIQYILVIVKKNTKRITNM